MRGTFSGSFDYHEFPFDWQQLNVSVQLPSDLPYTKARLIPHTLARPASAVAGSVDLPLWRIRCASIASHLTDYNQLQDWLFQGSNDPATAYFRGLSTAEVAQIGFADPDGNRWSAATLTVHVQRIPTFYSARGARLRSAPYPALRV